MATNSALMLDPDQVAAVVAGLEGYLAFGGEVQLADFGESAASGPWSKFRHADHQELDPFRGKDRASRSKAGQRYYMLLVEIGDDERAVDQEKRERLEQGMKGGAMAQHAGRLCRDREFQDYLQAIGVFDGFTNQLPEDIARDYILSTCEITTRKALDHSPRAAGRYRNFVMGQFLTWKTEGRA